MTTMPTSTDASHPTPTPKNSDSDRADNYGADQIKILEGLEAVRKRPGMYIGDTGLAGLHHLVWESVDNSIDEAMAGRATTVVVKVNADGSVSVTDDGSGIPIDIKSHENPMYDGKPAVEIVMTVLHAGGKFGEEGSAYKVSGGLHGVGISVVNALSEWLEVEVYRDGKIHKIAFERGDLRDPLHVMGDVPTDSPRKTGTRISFKPDHEMFPDTEFNAQVMSGRLRELAYLNPGITIRLIDERVGPDGKMRDKTFRFENGLVEYVEHLNHNKITLHPPIALSGASPDGSVTCDVALQYNDSYNELILPFANNIRTVDGGTHLSGFKTAMTRSLNTYAKRGGLLKEKDPSPSGEDLREGLAAVISVKLPEPQFEGQTKGKLRNTEIEGFISQIVGEKLGAWLDENPALAKKICQKGVLAAQAREAARKARDLTRRKSALESGSMPHKLRDCTTKDVDRSEMFIVEGDSAGGSATQGRDVETQAILPLRGKLLNVEKARLDRILAFEEIRTLISALRCGIGEEFDVSKLRYGRVIIMTDADVDGSHIRTLLLTFFFRQMPELIRRGKVFIAQPPLYLISRGKKQQYVLNESKMNDVLAELGTDGASLLVRNVDEMDDPSFEPPIVHTIEGDALPRLVRVLRRLDELVHVVERRGVKFIDMLSLRDQDPQESARLPMFRITWDAGTKSEHGEAWAWSEQHVDEILHQHKLSRPDLEAELENGHPSKSDDSHKNGVAKIRELHENRELAIVFTQLDELGLDINDYARTVEEAVTGERMPAKYAWQTPLKAPPKGGAKGHGGSASTASNESSETDSEDAAAEASATFGGVGVSSKRQTSPRSSPHSSTSAAVAWRSNALKVWAKWTPCNSGTPPWTLPAAHSSA